MNESIPVAGETRPLSPRARNLSRLVAGLGLGMLGAVLSYQMIHEPLASLGAGLGAAVVAFVAWGAIVSKDTGVGLGRAAAVGALAVLGGYVGMAIVGGVSSRIFTDSDAGVALLFSFWMVLPISLAFAVALAVAIRFFAARSTGGEDRAS